MRQKNLYFIREKPFTEISTSDWAGQLKFGAVMKRGYVTSATAVLLKLGITFLKKYYSISILETIAMITVIWYDIQVFRCYQVRLSFCYILKFEIFRSCLIELSSEKLLYFHIKYCGYLFDMQQLVLKNVNSYKGHCVRKSRSAAIHSITLP